MVGWAIGIIAYLAAAVLVGKSVGMNKGKQDE
jgi:hypothetical protein